MVPVSPVAKGFEDQEVVFAKDQPEYIPLPALVSEHGFVVTRWRPSEAELRQLNNGDDVQLRVWTFGQPLQPVSVTVADEYGRDVVV